MTPTGWLVVALVAAGLLVVGGAAGLALAVCGRYRLVEWFITPAGSVAVGGLLVLLIAATSIAALG